jgi:hypothetical protein
MSVYERINMSVTKWSRMWSRMEKKSVWNYRRLLRLSIAEFENENDTDWEYIVEHNERMERELNE